MPFIALACLINYFALCSVCFSCHRPIRILAQIFKVVCVPTSWVAFSKFHTYVRLMYGTPLFVTLLKSASVFLCAVWAFFILVCFLFHVKFFIFCGGIHYCCLCPLWVQHIWTNSVSVQAHLLSHKSFYYSCFSYGFSHHIITMNAIHNFFF